MRYLYIRHHGIPTQSEFHRSAIEIDAWRGVPKEIGEIKPASNLVDPVKISADIAKRTEKARADLVEAQAKAAANFDAAWRKTAYDGAIGHLAALAWAWDDDEPQSVIGVTADPLFAENVPQPVGVQNVDVRGERDALSNFWHSVTIVHGTKLGVPVAVVVHGESSIRFLWQRSKILRVDTPAWWPIGCAADNTRFIHDVNHFWTGHRREPERTEYRRGLKAVCREMGIDCPIVAEGWDFVSRGGIYDLAERTCGEVAAIRELHGRLLYPAAVHAVTLAPGGWDVVDVLPQSPATAEARQ